MNIGIVLGILIVLGSSSALAFISQPVSAQQTHIITKVLMDDAAGNALGWNPDGMTRVFTIQDSQFDQNSTVVVNTHQSNFVVCNVDYRYSGAFEVNCGQELEAQTGVAPAEGGRLHYTIIKMAPTTPESPMADIQAQGAQRTQQAAGNQTGS